MSQSPAVPNSAAASRAESPLVCDTLVIVGVGLIGGSIAAAARERGVARRVIGVGRQVEKLAGAISRRLIDAATSDLAAAASEADLIIFCTPVDRIAEGVRQAGNACRPQTVMTDAGSTKQQICDSLERKPPQQGEFLGSHPIAGSERSGYENSQADLFQGRPCVITPVSGTTEHARKLVHRFWAGLGSRLFDMTPAEHDRALAEISHAPHVVAAALARTLTPAYAPLVGSGFRDTTRIAAGDADLWTSIARSNRQMLGESLDRYQSLLMEFRQALADDDAARLKELFEAGAKIRESLAPDRHVSQNSVS